MSTFCVAEGRIGNKVLVVGFDDFTAIEYSILERLAINCELQVFNYFSKSSNKHIYNQEVYQQLKNIAYINELGFNVEEVKFDKTDLKQFITQNLFAVNSSKFEMKDEMVKIFSLKSVDDEIELVARQIRNKILHGEEFKTDAPNGWTAVTVCGATLGGVKVVNGTAKNHYPKGIRIK